MKINDNQIHVTWYLTKNFLIPCKMPDGSTSFDTNMLGRYWRLQGEVVITTESVRERLDKTLAPNAFLGWFDIASEIFELNIATPAFIASLEAKMLDRIKEYLANNTLDGIQQQPKHIS